MIDFSLYSREQTEQELVYQYKPLKNYKTSEDQLQDLSVTNKFKFDLNHPVDIEVQNSYDGSVNLILTDGKNTPRMINSRFAVLQDNKYKIIDRTGDNDSSIYSEETFDSDTSLFKVFKTHLKVNLTEISQGGNLKVGNYVFYFKYSDADGNTTNIAGESGLCACYVGEVLDSQSYISSGKTLVAGQIEHINGAYCDFNSSKRVVLSLSQIDTAFDYIEVYYSRSSSDQYQLTSTTCFRILDRFPINQKSSLEITITGNENVEQIPESELNQYNEILSTAYTQTISHNTLLLGNVQRHVIEYEELKDLSLRIYPEIKFFEDSITGETSNWPQWHPSNIYYSVGYWPEEFYRFGIVYIYNNNKLSPVFNIRGLSTGKLTSNIEKIYDSTGTRNYIIIDEDTQKIQGQNCKDNALGVLRVPVTLNNKNTDGKSYYLKFHFPEGQELLNFRNELSKQGITGYIIVRQKRIPTILAQALCVAHDPNLGVPMVKLSKWSLTGDSAGDWASAPTTLNYCAVPNFWEKLRSDGGQIFNGWYTEKQASKQSLCAYCPDYTLRQPYFNQLFTGEKFSIRKISDKLTQSNQSIITSGSPNNSTEQSCGSFINNSDNPVYIKYNLIKQGANSATSEEVKIVSVKEDCPAVVVDDIKFSSRLGTAEEVKDFAYNATSPQNFTTNVNTFKQDQYYQYGENDDGEPLYAFSQSYRSYYQELAPMISRGIWSPFLGLVFDSTNSNISDYYDRVINIYIPGYKPIISNDQDLKYEDLLNQLKLRFNDNSPYFAIGNRMDLYEDPHGPDYMHGDCYFNIYTQRMYRNFQDPAAPNNDQIVKTTSYDTLIQTDGVWSGYENINRGDLNAIKLGTWLTFSVFSTNNLNIRSIDDSHTSEIALTGNIRSFFPYKDMSVEGNNKIPEAMFINEGFSQSTGVLKHFNYQSVPYTKNIFQNRIYYSNIAITDGYQNGFRIFKPSNYRDYNISYGAITKLVEYMGKIIIVFEHGIGVVQLTSPQEQATEYINIANQLPEIPDIISNVYGSCWPDSVIATDSGVYGVDTITKRIWRYSLNGGFQIISELLIDSFLRDNITFNRLDNTPTIAIKNCKAHYNRSKQDILFTFYSPYNEESIGVATNGNIEALDELAWNICYNEKLGKWSSFYSWIPLLSENINGSFVSFDKELARDIILNNSTNSTMYLYKHGTLELGPWQERVTPTFWYGKQHPFEFEFIVSTALPFHKIFNNLILISNKAKPESFHYTITGDCYDFFLDKPIIYFRQEATKALFSSLGSHITFDADLKDKDAASNGTYLWHFDKPELNPFNSSYIERRSTTFPLTYMFRADEPNRIEDIYRFITQTRKDFSNLSGTEVIRENKEFHICTHARAIDMKEAGRLRGNMQYKEDRWFIQINPITLVQKNELIGRWANKNNSYYPPIVIGNTAYPNDIQQFYINSRNIPEFLQNYYGYTVTNIDTDNWGTYYNQGGILADANTRQEAKIKDKYIKIRIRYNGEEQASIHSILTQYTEVNR